MDQAYQEIQRRVGQVEAKKPAPLRQALTELLINHPAVRPHDQCPPATDKMVRYKLATGASLGHQIDTGPQHLWVAVDSLPPSFSGAAKLYPATEGGKGRHSNVNQMPDLRDSAVARITVADLSEAERLLNELLARRGA